MMKREYHKIFWRPGQEITPETFIQADNYMIAQQNLIRKLLNRQYYGLLPADEVTTPIFSVKASFRRSDVYIDQLTCFGLTRDGCLITLGGDDQLNTLSRRVSIAACSPGNIYYVVMRVRSFEQSLMEPVENEETPYSLPVYEFDVKELKRIEGDELPILKIDFSQQNPEIETNYIPPCMSISSCQALTEQYAQLKQAVADILTSMTKKQEQYRKVLAPVTFLLFDLEQLSPNEPPYYLIQLLKKTIKTIGFFVKEIQIDHAPVLTEAYIHEDIVGMLQALAKCFHDIQLFIGQHMVVVEVEEDFTPRI